MPIQARATLANRWVRPLLACILLAYLVVGGLYAVQTPDWQVPDEPAHYNYVRHLAEKSPFPHFPVLEGGDYEQAYLQALLDRGFPAHMSIQVVEYEDHQPPLYYLLATPVYGLFDGALLPLRLFSLLIGLGVILTAYAVAARLYPARPLIPLGTAAFVAFLPQHVAMMAGVNNDGLAELLIGLVLWLSLGLVLGGSGTRRPVCLLGLGGILGLGLLTKATVYPVAVPVAGLALLLAPRGPEDAELPHCKALARDLALVLGPALLLGLGWWLRNLSQYGGLDLLGLANHDAVVVGQPRTAAWIERYGLGAWLERGLTFSFQSFWGQFGWMGVLMPTWLYRALAAWSGLLLLGLGWYLIRNANPGPREKRAAALLVSALLFTLLAYAYYNRTFVQHQGRYLYPALIPISLAVALAIDAWLRSLRLPRRLHAWAFAAPYVAMVGLDLYALWRLILPALT